MADQLSVRLKKTVEVLRKEFGSASNDSDYCLLFESFMENTNEPVIFIDSQGNLLFGNPAFGNMFGYSQSEQQSLNILDVCCVESGDVFIHEALPALGSGEGWEGEFCSVGKQGRIRHIHGRLDSVLDSQKNVIIGLLIMHDISEKKKLEETWQEHMKKISSSERLAAAGRLAASLTHEINNPLQAMSLNLEFVKRAIPEDFPEWNSLNQIDISIKRIKDTVNQLLDLHRSKINVIEVLDVHQILVTTLDVLKNQLMIRNISVIKYLSSKSPYVLGVKPDLYHVFMNIVLNAHDAMENGGTLQIRSYDEGGSIFVEFQDTGVGIHETDLERIFDPFYTTKSSVHGTGLGLSTTKSSVERFGGNITVKSDLGVGSIFRLEFPISEK